MKGEMNTTNLLEISKSLVVEIEGGLRGGTKKTPLRMAKSFQEIFSGYNLQVPITTFPFQGDKDSKQLVTLMKIKFFSMCEHHMLPFFGEISVGYIPNDKVIGVSKLARIVEKFSKRMTLQEQLVADVIKTVESIYPRGVIVHCSAKHLCMAMRGVKKPNSVMNTLQATGECNNKDIKNEFLSMLKESK